tara:strand:+ start:5157 stop:6830 length:1674 start_codon:yes stop_codon:yes gene_type:complete
MAYNSQKGNQHSGDIQYEGDPNDTQIDFENDLVALKTNGVQRLIVSASAVTSSVVFSGSYDVYGHTFRGTSVSASTGITGSSLRVGAYGLTNDGKFAISSLTLGGTAITSNAGELNLVDGTSAGTVVNNKAVIYSGTGQVNAIHLSAASGITGSSLRMGAYGLTNAGQLAISSFNTNWTNAGRTVANLGSVTTADINGGTLDNVVIGGSTQNLAKVTTLDASNNVQIATTLGVTGSISGSHGSLTSLSLGPENTTTTTLYVRAPTNGLVAIFKSPLHDSILAVTGSGRVAVGGALVDAKLNVTGSDTDKLLSLKSSRGNVFAVSGSGKAYLSGSLTLNSIEPTIHFSSSAGANLGQIGINSSDNILIQNSTINKHIVFKASDAGTLREGLRIDGAVPEVVVNQGSDSLVDFRVESNNNTHMLFVDGGTEKVGINTATPANTFSVNGTTHLSGSVRYPVAVKTANYSLTVDDSIIIFNHGSVVTGTLPTIVAGMEGSKFTVKNIGSAVARIIGDDDPAQNIDGVSTGVALAQGDCIQVVAFPIGSGYDWATLHLYDAS